MGKAKREVFSWVASVRDGTMSLTEFRESMRRMIKTVHMFSAASARGGWASMTSADWDAIDTMVLQEFTYLERLVGRVATGALPMDGRFKQYAGMYADAGKETFYDRLRVSQGEAGRRQERNIMTKLENCGGCKDESAKGWVKRGRLSLPGTRDCRRNCGCYLEFR
jgi:hypothetical protein